MLTSLKSCHSPCTWHCHHAAERDARFYPSMQRCGHPIRQIWIRWTTASGISFKRGSTVRGSMMWRSWKNVCWESGGCWTTPSSSSSSSQQRFRNDVVVWMHVSRERWTFWTLLWVFDFLLCLFVSSILVSVNVIDINMCKVLILCEMCYFCVWHFHTVW